MIPVIAGLSMVNTFRPYLRSHVMQNIAAWEFIFINSVVIGFVSFIYAYIYKQEKITKLFTLKWTQYCAAILIGSLTVLSTAVYLAYESNGIMKTNFLWRGVSSVVFILAGLFLFGEKMFPNQIVGVLVIVAGSFLIAMDGGKAGGDD
jgi:drug/metabolite transporter (DMT)-like permease